MTRLVIVESPTKARTISSFLPEDCRVEASMGHVRDLPSSASEVPARVKGKDWARMGVDIENDFKPLYVVPAGKKKVVKKLREISRNADEILLATDEDREGESIGWHLTEVLGVTGPVKRMVFHEITEEAIARALRAPRELDLHLVRSQEARRILDRLVGYTISPLLWKKIAPKLSAGRVQSVAVRLLVNRERERMAFRSALYFDLKALLNKRPDRPDHRFEADLISLDGKRLATGKDFDRNTGRVPEGKDLILLNKDEAEELAGRLKDGAWTISDISENRKSRHPYPPFTTATLQIEANRKLGMSASRTMKVAQKLYENGYITYMRTDSVNLSSEAITAARKKVVELYGNDYLQPQPRRYRTKTKGAQEAHEAIRPAGTEMRSADRLPLSKEERALYKLIWCRTIATQMKPARIRFQTVLIEVDRAVFKASGRQVEFPGFFRAYVAGSDRADTPGEDRSVDLPRLEVGEEIDCRDLTAQSHRTQPPARYTEAALVKVLEKEGIGRPSTYASIINTIVRRGYVSKRRKELIPTFTAFAVCRLMENHFSELVDINFTAEMEENLDSIADGDNDWIEYLRQFYLGEDGLAARVREKEENVSPRTIFAFRLDDPKVEVRIGRYGPFISWEEDGETLKASIPPSIPPADLNTEFVRRIMLQKSEGPLQLGTDPESGLPVYFKIGPFGYYLQRGENGKGKDKPKRVKLPEEFDPEDLRLETALKLLSLPRPLGKHPESGKSVRAGLGRFGPYVVHDGTYASLTNSVQLLEIELEEALKLLKTSGKKKTSRSSKTIKELGEHPADGTPVRVMNGRFGPFIRHGKLNASIPKNRDPEEIELEEAMELLEAKKKRKKKKKRTRKKAASAAKKSAGAKSRKKKKPASKS